MTIDRVTLSSQFQCCQIPDGERRVIGGITQQWSIDAKNRSSDCLEKAAVLKNLVDVCFGIHRNLVDRKCYSSSHEVHVVLATDPSMNHCHCIQTISLVKREKDHLELLYLATNPQNLCPLPGESSVKGAGRALIDSLCLKGLSLGLRQIKLMSFVEARDFYHKMGFYLTDDWGSMEAQISGPFAEKAWVETRLRVFDLG